MEYFMENRLISKLFEDRVKSAPNKIALKENTREISYEKLNDFANCISYYLLDNNVNVGDRVAILLNNSIECIASILAKLKVGATYVPLDILSDTERKIFCLDDAKCKCLITSNKYKDEFLHYVKTINVDLIKLEKRDNPNITYTFDDEAYIIYTSGSTGIPKGVLITHKSLNFLLGRLEDKFQDDIERKVYLLNTSLNFDVSISEIFAWFFGGSYTLVIKDNSGDFNIESLIDLIDKHSVSRLNVAPSLLHAILEHIKYNADSTDRQRLKSLKYIFSAGEELQANLVKLTYKYLPHLKLFNLYGPTEATVYATYYETEAKSDIVPIGYPFEGLTIKLLDENNQLTEQKMGELLIAGDSLAREYINQSALTEKSFVYLNDGGEYRRFYKTGDIAYFDKEGRIIFKGRKDRQIKIRGIRLELGEVEHKVSKLLKRNLVAATYEKFSAYDSGLVIYISGEKEDTHYQILRDNLPRYMFPLRLIHLDEFPLTLSGKIDYKKLKNSTKQTLGEQRPLETELERKVFAIVKNITSTTLPESDLDFFDLGANSLKVAQLIAEIKKVFDVTLRFEQVYRSSRISDIAKYIKNNEFYNNIDSLKDKIKSHCKSINNIQLMNGNKLLFISDQLTDEDLQNIRKELGDNYFPNIVLNKKEEELFNNINADFSDLIERSIAVADKFNELINSYIFKQEDQIKYNCMNIQDFFIASGKKEVLPCSIKLEKIHDLSIIDKLIDSLIKHISVFHTYIRQENSKNIFVEKIYEKLDLGSSVSSFSINISKFNSIIQKKIMNEINEKLAESIYFPKSDNLLYRIVIYQTGYRDYEISFLVDHKIFDGKSRTLVNNIASRVINNKDIYLPSYGTYVERMNQLATREKFISFKTSATYKKQLDIQRNIGQVQKLVLSDSTIQFFGIEEFQNKEYKYADFYEVLALYFALQVVRDNFSFDQINIRLTNNARFFDHKFIDTVGDFHFYSILSVDTKCSLDDLFKVLSEYRISMFDEEKLFLDFMAHKKFKEEDFAGEIRNQFRTCPFAFNFIGNIERDEIDLYRQAQSKAIANYYLMMAFLCDKKIGVILPNGVEKYKDSIH